MQLEFTLDLAGLDEPRARSSDPETSHAAASSAKDLQAKHSRQILAALEQYGPMGKDGIARRTGLSGTQVARRTFELAGEPVKGIPKPGKPVLIRETGQTVLSDSGRAEREWERV